MLTQLWRRFQDRNSRSQPSRRRLEVELLESRLTPSATAGLFTPLIVAGDETGAPPDSPGARVDPNTTASYFSGVGSVKVVTNNATYIGTGALLTDSNTGLNYVLTAGHVVDINNDGKFDSRDRVKSVTFYLNFGGDRTHEFTVSSVTVNPNYQGFNKPGAGQPKWSGSVNDDLAILGFTGALPEGAQTYGLYSGPLQGQVITMVGYGQSGYGDVGYTVGAWWSTKRVGQNVVDAFYAQDDKGLPAANEVFRFDFDGPTASSSTWGGGTLGNNVETTLGGGDSGGPSFVWVGGVPYIAGVNTFGQTGKASAPLFGSLGGGIVVGAYTNWLGQNVQGLVVVVTGPLDSAPGGIPGTGTQASIVVALNSVQGGQQVVVSWAHNATVTGSVGTDLSAPRVIFAHQAVTVAATPAASAASVSTSSRLTFPCGAYAADAFPISTVQAVPQTQQGVYPAFLPSPASETELPEEELPPFLLSGWDVHRQLAYPAPVSLAPADDPREVTGAPLAVEDDHSKAMLASLALVFTGASLVSHREDQDGQWERPRAVKSKG